MLLVVAAVNLASDKEMAANLRAMMAVSTLVTGGGAGSYGDHSSERQLVC